MSRRAEAGVTLVEVLVSLVIFALIGVAGFGMLDQVLRTERLTEGRLDRLGQMSRAMQVITLDFATAEGGSLDAGQEAVSINRAAPGMTGGSVRVGYVLAGGVLVRRLQDVGGQGLADQLLLDGVAAADWQFLDAELGWVSTWPVPERVAVLTGRPKNPQAVAVTLTLAGTGQVLRRVALSPGEVR